jgi:SAM-dependent methyltransferase
VTDQATTHSQQVRQLFDAKASSWQAKYAPDGRLAARLTQLADMVGYHVGPAGTVLDLGCGTGDLARHLSGAGFKVTGCDISQGMLMEAAAARPGGAVQWVPLDPDWQVLPFPATAFDAVVASSVLEYVHSPADVLAECSRMLGPGGIMLATVPDPGHPIRWLEAAVRAAALAPGARAVDRRWPRLGRYLTYLRISRHRHAVGWWSKSAARAGMLTVPLPPDPHQHTPLRLLIFQRPALSERPR